MGTIKRILVVDEKNGRFMDAALLLRIADYEVILCEDLETAINRYVLYENTQKSFDLLLAAVNKENQEILEKLHLDGIIFSMILFREIDCVKAYCIEGLFANLCQPSALLTCIKEMECAVGNRPIVFKENN